MLMPDVNILVYAHRTEEPAHAAYRTWLEELVNGPEPFALTPLTVVGFVRVVTNRKIFPVPTPIAGALGVIDDLAQQANCRWITPGANHWQEVARLCRATSASGKLVADAAHAALAISGGCSLVTRDADFAKFAPHGLRWKLLELAA
jgi:uncharacterized protein